jgi:hypothetical protein
MTSGHPKLQNMVSISDYTTSYSVKKEFKRINASRQYNLIKHPKTNKNNECNFSHTSQIIKKWGE